MDVTDKERIQNHLSNHFSEKSNRKLEKLLADHDAINSRVATYTHRAFLTKKEELELKKLKFKKLRQLDEIMNICRA